MRYLRTLSTRSLLVLAVAAVVVAVGGTALAVAAGRSSGPTPAAKPLARAVHDSLAAPDVPGITARIRFTNHLFPSGALVGANLSALMSGASGRLWMTNDGRGRLELQSDAGDAQVMWNRDQLTVYDASSNTVYTLKLPSSASSSSPTDAGQPPSVSEINDFLTKLGRQADVSAATPTDVAGRPAYSVKISPRHDGGLLGYLQLAWDAQHSVPLRIGIYAQGSASPVLQLAATDISYGSVSSSDVTVTPPAGTKTVDLSAPSKPDKTGSTEKPDFTVVSPDTLVGLPRQDIRNVNGGALVVYGKGLGAIVVLERKADANAPSGVMSALPRVSLDGLTGHELATQLGTAIQWTRNGVSFVLVGSLPPAAAESAARALK